MVCRYEDGEISFRDLITKQMSCVDLSFEEGIARIAAGCRQHTEQATVGSSTSGSTTDTGVVDPGFCHFVSAIPHIRLLPDVATY